MEIGSEFWKNENQYIEDNETIYLSGRTALDIIIRDAISNFRIKSVLLPSYCCHTMIKPFQRNHVGIRFYDVYVNDAGKLTAYIPSPKNHEMLYVMKYFGDTEIQYEGDGNGLTGWSATVEDLTHSCFNSSYKTEADYWFTSYRKWAALDGIAVAGKRNSRLAVTARGINSVYTNLRNEAFMLKSEYMLGGSIEKSSYLDIFADAERVLGEDYFDYGARAETIALLVNLLKQADDLRSVRRKNASVLYEGVQEISGIRTFLDFKDESKCPLFIPILVEGGRRDALRKHLIDKEIYLPVHWPLSDCHNGISERGRSIYDEELSLVCDQRYGEEDMCRIVDEIKEFMNR